MGSAGGRLRLSPWFAFVALILLPQPSARAAGLATWVSEWNRLDAASARSRSLAEFARDESLRSNLRDSLLLALSDSIPPEPPSDPAAAAWCRRRVVEGLHSASPKVLDWLERNRLSETDRMRWDPQGDWTLGAGLALMSRSNWTAAGSWLESGAVDRRDRGLRARLRVECLLAAGDTLAAAESARAALADSTLSPDGLGDSDRRYLERTTILGAVANRDFDRARRELRGSRAAALEPLFRWTAERRLAALAGESERADSLDWVIVREAPESKRAKQLLESLVAPTAPSLPADRLYSLLAVAEKQGDLERFLALESAISALGAASEDPARELRGAKLAYRRKAYDRIRAEVGRGNWRPSTADAPAWALLLGRAYRNRGVPDSMSTWYELAVQRGSAEDRGTALWEWARELEFLGRFAEADTLYGRFLDAGAGDKRADAILRRGYCRFLSRKMGPARRAFALAAEVGDAPARAAGQFWLYRVALAEGDSAAALENLRRAAAGSGYYGRRAASALAFRRGRGIAESNVSGYWDALRDLIEEDEALSAYPALPSSYLRADSVALGLDLAGRRLRRSADRLQLFRQYARTADASAAQEALLADPALGDAPSERRARLFLLGFPDLACRDAIRKGAGVAERFPTPYLPATAHAAAGADLAPEMLWSLMRRESVFEATAVSPAGAVGLMQFMEATASSTAAAHGIPASPRSSPEVSIALGAAHFSDLLDDSGGDVPASIAGYNAGIDNALRWRRPGEDLDIYVERIGYRETREYVMAVLEGFWIYRSLLRSDGD